MIKNHGLTGNTKRRVFDALIQRQQGKCAICGISQEELLDAALKRHNRRHPNKPLAPVHSKLHIDHCHKTGRIRGLLCESCNSKLGMAESRGILHYFYLSAFESDYPQDMGWLLPFMGAWLKTYRGNIIRYMKEDAWLPAKDILFHLQSEAVS